MRRLGPAASALIAVIAWTAAFSATAAACPNEALRTGASAQLPNCRAYELVTPPDSNGRLLSDIAAFRDPYDLFPAEPVSPSGNSFVFETGGSALPAPLGGNGKVYGDRWETQRGPTGWQVVRHVTPSGAELPTPEPGGLSADHDYNFVFAPLQADGISTNGSLTAEGEADYLGDPSGHFELTGVGSLGVERLVQGRYISPGGKHVIFSTGRSPAASGWCYHFHHPPAHICPVAKLEPDAPPAGTGAIYDREADGPTHVVSLLPGDVTPAAGEEAFYQGAAADGSSVAFTIGEPLLGTLYIRVNNGAENAKTEKVSANPTTFGGISDDGRYLYYLSGVSEGQRFRGDIHRFDTVTEEDQVVNSSGDAEMVNVSADGSHVYFISPSQLDGSKGTAGERNLYAWSGGSPEYVATVDTADTEGGVALNRWAQASAPSAEQRSGPGSATSRTTPDGSVIVFESHAQLTSYDNAGHSEIYRYDNEDKSLICVSCNPDGTPASADAHLETMAPATVFALEPSTVIHNVTNDGTRVFFESSEALVESDGDTVNDVYEWQQTPSGGTLMLISSGHSTEYAHTVPPTVFPNLLMGVSPSGDDVLFTSFEPLLPGAPVGGAPAVYDARVDGGFPAPLAPVTCSEEACRPPAFSPPALGAAGSAGLRGAGNVTPSKRGRKHHHRRCHRRANRHKRRGCTGTRTRRSARATAGNSVAGTTSSAAAAKSPTVLLNPATARARLTLSPAGFGLQSVAASVSTMAAAEHPDFTTKFALTPPDKSGPGQSMENLMVEIPPGLYGNPNLAPRCKAGDLIGGECPVDSQVGVSRLLIGGRPEPVTVPLFNLAPVHPDKEIARFGVMITNVAPVFIDISVNTAGDYGVTAAIHGGNTLEPLEEAETIIWGNPADPSHDKERITIQEGENCGTPFCVSGGERPSGLEPIAFLTNPSACGPLEVGFSVTSYQLPGQVFSKSASVQPGPIDECEGLPFEPSFEAHPTSQVAGAPTGLETVLRLPQSTDPAVPSTATMREAKVTLPAGMGIAAGAADGLAACSEEQVHFHEEQDAQCPDASKLGAVKIVSPALSEPLEGALYQRSPEPGHLFRLWLVSDGFGLHVKLPGEIHADPGTGQLTAVFSDLPPVPVEEIELDVWGGPRAPLKNPDSCGTYQTQFSFTPHSNDPPVSGQSAMTIDEGCGPAGFSPQLHGGATDPVAGAFSPFVLDLTREDGEQNLAGFAVTLPKGELAKLAGVPLCGEAQAASGACPADSKIGSVIAASGPGPDPLWLPQPGKSPTAVYLSGPYKGAPYSAVSVVPAQAGPFDLGDVVVRSALEVDPTTALATVKTDPLPQFIEGVPVIYRRLHVIVDRPNFTLNPTDCSQQSITSSVSSTQGAIAHPSERFEVDGCSNLAYGPKLKLFFRGSTKRSGDPAVKAVLTQPPNQANTAAATVVLPSSEFIDQAHINNPCTRVQFSEGACPKSSILGTARAITPLLDQPLKGPVYFRSNGGERELPDIVADLHGQIHITLVGFIDSVQKKGTEISRVRTRFENVPDAPVTKFVISFHGGKRGLIENHVDLCGAKHRAKVDFKAQNGRIHSSRPVIRTSCRRKGP